MPKFAQYTLRWSVDHRRYELHDGGDVSVLRGATWLGWLNEHHSFAFLGRSGRMSLVKEQRKGQYNYWYAFRRQGKRVLKRYAGRSDELTFAHLEELSQALAEPAAAPFVSQPAIQPASRTAAVTIPLLASKFRLPHLIASLVQRERLLARLDAGRAGKLTLISAPAGFGKSTLIRQWLETVAEASPPTLVAWLSLDVQDNDLLRFWRYLITACRVFAPQIGSQSLAWLDAATSVPSSLESLPLVFVNEVESMASQGILVLEDYHVIGVPPIHEALGFLLEHTPPALHIVLITRSTPPLPLVRLRAAYQLTEITAADLRFSAQETLAFLELYSDLSLSRDELQQVETRIEGWAAGLRLLTLALQGHQDRESLRLVLTNVAAGWRGIGDYFVAEVLNNQPEPLQRFLLETSFLSSLTASLCDSVTLRTDSQALLEEVQRANLFLEPLDGVGMWYRYHALFATAMQAAARHRLGEAAVRELVERALDWYAAHSMIDEAINAAFAIQDVRRAADLITIFTEREYRTEPPHVGPPEFYSLKNWLAQLPQPMLDERPLLSLAAANAILFASLFEIQSLSGSQVQQIEHALQRAEHGFKHFGNSAMLGYVYAVRSLLDREQDRLAPAVQWAEAALALLPPLEFTWRSLCISMIGQAEHFAGQLGRAADRNAEARAVSEKNADEPLARLHSIALGQVYIEQNKYHEACALLLHVLDESKVVGDIADTSQALAGLATISLAWNELETAWAQAAEAVEIMSHYPHAPSYSNALLLLARVELARGEGAAALRRCEALLAAHGPGSSLPEQQLHANIAFVQATIALLTGDLRMAQRWRVERRSDLEQARIRQDEDELLLARLLIAEGQPGAAAVRIAPLLATAEREGRERIALETRVLLALACAAQQQQQGASDWLAGALAQARSANIQRVFVDAGEQLTPYLRAAALEHTPVATFARTLLRGAPGRAIGSDEALSQQERRVLSLVVQGRSNAAIAADLIISVNTVKAHIKAIYRKLNVSNRVEAASAARALELL